MEEELSGTALLKTFLSARGLHVADGRPLYAYRCGKGELNDLQRILEHTAFDSLTQNHLAEMAPLFVLYASDWWRRFHVGGSWKWESVLKSIDLPIISLNELYPAVTAGLRFWNRPLLTNTHGRMFLVTLACEGGLPLEMLRKEGARLRRFFRKVLEDYGLYWRAGVPARELARRNEQELPRSWRQDVVFELGGKLVEEIWTLQDKVRKEKDPIAALNQIEPGWRERLPLEVSDEIAVTLLNNLVIEAGRIREGGSADFRLSRTLRREASGWRLSADLSVPPVMDGKLFSAILSLDVMRIPSRGQLMLVSSTGEAVTAAYVTELRRDNEPAYRIETASLGGRIKGAAASSGWSLQFESASPGHIRGGEPLSEDLPWVFGEHDEGLFRFVGQGSVRTRYPKCLVAIPRSMAVSAPPLLEAIEGLDRILVEATGDLELSAADSRFLVRVAQARDEVADVSLVGELFTLVADGREVFHGLPSVFVTDADGRRQAVRPELLQWKPTRGRDWIPWSEACCGRVSVRLVEKNETRFQRTVEIVPRDVHFRMLPRSMNEGGIEIQGVGSQAVGCRDDSCTTSIEGTDNAALIAVRCDTRPPAAIEFDFDLGQGRTLTLPLPFPCRGARFVASGDAVLRYEACVYVESLTECRVEGYGAREAEQRRSDQFLVEGVLEAKDIPPEVASRTWATVPFSPTGRQLLELRTMVRPIRDLLSQTRDLDAYVTLRIDGPDVRHTKIVIKRYDRVFEIGDDGVAIREETDKHAVFNADRYRAEAVRLWDPAAGREQLAFDSDSNRWRWKTEGRDAGPWLLIGWEGGAARVRPALAPVQGDIVDRSPLQRAICLGSGQEVKQALRTQIERLILAPLDPDWSIIGATLRLAIDVPPTSLLLANALALEPKAAVLALIHAGEDRQVVWDAMESLRFEWFLVPVSDWLEILPRYEMELNRLVGEAAPGLATEHVASVVDFIDASTERALLKPLTELLRWRLLGIRPDSLFMTKAEGRSRGDELTTLRQSALARNSEKIWPNGMMIRRWLDATHTGILRTLLVQSGDMPGFRKVVLTAPILAADHAVTGRTMDRDILFEIRQARRFDPEWFDGAYSVALQILLADGMSNEAVFV